MCGHSRVLFEKKKQKKSVTHIIIFTLETKYMVLVLHTSKNSTNTANKIKIWTQTCIEIIEKKTFFFLLYYYF